MATIVSRKDTDPGRVKELQDIIIEFGGGSIGEIGSGAKLEVADNLDGLINQAHGVMLGMKLAIGVLAAERDMLVLQNGALSLSLDVASEMLDLIVNDIGYDQALDGAATTLMDNFISSGAANASADGEMVFDARIAISKEDIKPMLREAIVDWVEARLAQ